MQANPFPNSFLCAGSIVLVCPLQRKRTRSPSLTVGASACQFEQLDELLWRTSKSRSEPRHLFFRNLRRSLASNLMQHGLTAVTKEAPMPSFKSALPRSVARANEKTIQCGSTSMTRRSVVAGLAVAAAPVSHWRRRIVPARRLHKPRLRKVCTNGWVACSPLRRSWTTSAMPS